MTTQQEKRTRILDLFASCTSKESIYSTIIEMGRKAPTFSDMWKTEENRVHGCQSTVYLHVERGDTLIFSAWSDALISAGLAQLLVMLYSDETAENILRTPPKILEELNIPTLLTPGRANGLASMWKMMQKIALEELSKK